jgi:peptide chain release factor 1
MEDIEFNKEVLNGDDAEMRDLAKLELPGLEEKKEDWKKLRNMLIPKDPYDRKKCNSLRYVQVPVAMKLRFLAGDLLRMYLNIVRKRMENGFA